MKKIRPFICENGKKIVYKQIWGNNLTQRAIFLLHSQEEVVFAGNKENVCLIPQYKNLSLPMITLVKGKTAISVIPTSTVWCSHYTIMLMQSVWGF